jgi:hypothetical protein
VRARPDQAKLRVFDSSRDKGLAFGVHHYLTFARHLGQLRDLAIPDSYISHRVEFGLRINDPTVGEDDVVKGRGGRIGLSPDAD